MTDRELLELAAKAAGIDVDGWIGGSSKIRVLHPKKPPRISVGYEWNPLTDDGDAIRLAVKLGMTIAPFPAGARVRFQNHILDTCEVEVSGDDPYAATRRAIVCAAAEMGTKLITKPDSLPDRGNTTCKHNMQTEQVAVPMTVQQIEAQEDRHLEAGAHGFCLGVIDFARAIEAHHGIGVKT